MARDRDVMICSIVVVAVVKVIILEGVAEQLELNKVGGTLLGRWMLAVAQPAVFGFELTALEVG